MKEGFLFGLGFSLVYFATQYTSSVIVYYLHQWYMRRLARKQLLGGTMAAGQGQAQREVPPAFRN